MKRFGGGGGGRHLLYRRRTCLRVHVPLAHIFKNFCTHDTHFRFVNLRPIFRLYYQSWGSDDGCCVCHLREWSSTRALLPHLSSPIPCLRTLPANRSITITMFVLDSALFFSHRGLIRKQHASSAKYLGFGLGRVWQDWICFHGCGVDCMRIFSSEDWIF
jgi:hypothetical protein